MKLSTIFFLCILMLSQLKAQQNSFEIPSIFSDNMVLQQNSNAPFWGKAEPGSKVSITSSWGKKAETIVQNDGSWKTQIETPTAGGPFEVTLKIADSVRTFKNVLVGEVWVCSGQSNMEMPLEGWPPNDTIMTSAAEIKNANYPNLRLFTVQRKFSEHPEFNCIGEWNECSPEEAAKFSATAFFFGKKLHKELNIPIGLIHTSWGGTPVEAWTSAEYLSQIESYKAQIAKIDDAKEELKKLDEWRNNLPVVDISAKEESERWKNLSFNDADCSFPEFNDNNWKEMNLPILWENTEVGNLDGVVWFRKKVEIPDAWINKDLTIELGPIDDMDVTYINGQKIGSNEEDGLWQKIRIYKIPKEIVKGNSLSVAVRVLDNQGGGGIYGDKESMKIYYEKDKSISITGAWKYLPVAEFADAKFYVFGTTSESLNSRPKVSINYGANAPTMLYNGMIAPIVPYSIKGAIWYQGESNVYNANMYTKLFSLMIKNWRADWNNEFPFYFVQIAPFDYGDNSKSELLREAQFKTLSVPQTGMAVTLDIGHAKNIHPANKTDVGNRLALWALAKDYNKDVVCSGPCYKEMKKNGEGIQLSFNYAENGLILKDESNFLIAGEDKVFKPAKVKIDGNTIVVYNPEIKNPSAVRYAWSNTSEATLFNKEGLPASSFRTDVWSE